MTLSILLRTMDYRGDHSADIYLAFSLKPSETVEELATRLLSSDGYGRDVIEIRLVKTEEEATK